MYELNEERLAYLNARGKVILNACPGSGKTTTIARKIMHLQELNEIGDYSGLACLSFTNSAKDELNDAYTKLTGKVLQFPNHVSTIDSFINKFITLPFYNLLDRNFGRPKILDHTNILDDMWKTRYQDKKGNWKDGLKRPLNDDEYRAKNNRSVYHLYPPSDIRIEPNNSYSINGNQPSTEKVDKQIFVNYCKLIKHTQFSKGLISTSDSAFIALHLLRKNPKICEWLSLRFPYIIIDEAQDNSLLQHAIFEELSKQDLKNIELIGDPYQSLYEWRDATPFEFLRKYSGESDWQPFDLSDNRRSPQSIIDIFSLLRKSDDVKINSLNCIEKETSVVIYKYNVSNFQSIISHYENFCDENFYTQNSIVARGNALKNFLLGKKLEQVPWSSKIPKEIITAKNLFSGGDIKAAINEIRRICINLIYNNSDYHTVKDIEKQKKEDHQFNALLISILNELPSFDQSIADWSSNTTSFLKVKLGLNYDIDFKVRNRKSKNFEKKTLTESVNLHFKKSYSELNIPITTIHQVKGRSLDSILVFFNEKKHKDNILFNDICNEDNIFPDEAKRLIYVALSRPKSLLAMAFPDSISDEEIYTKFGQNLKIIPLS